MEFPDNLRYSKDHEWIRVEADGTSAVIGITDFAQSALGDIVYVELENINASFGQDEPFGDVDAVKTTSELFMPVAGTIIEHNTALEDTPELINNSPYEDGWMIKITMDNPADVDKLMNASEYANMVG